MRHSKAKAQIAKEGGLVFRPPCGPIFKSVHLIWVSQYLCMGVCAKTNSHLVWILFVTRDNLGIKAPWCLILKISKTIILYTIVLVIEGLCKAILNVGLDQTNTNNISQYWHIFIIIIKTLATTTVKYKDSLLSWAPPENVPVQSLPGTPLNLLLNCQFDILLFLK